MLTYEPNLISVQYFGTLIMRVNKGIENKGIVFKARWFVRLNITRARPFFKWNDEGIALVIPRQNNGHARVHIKPYKADAL